MKLGDVFKITSGGTPDTKNPSYYEGGNIPWIKTGDLKEKYISESVECITEAGLNNSSAKIFPAGTVLVAMYGATIGACSILPFEAATNQACAAFIPNDNILPNYLYYFLCSRKKRFIQDGVGGAQPNISAKYLKNVEFLYLSLPEQNHIAAILDKASDIISLRKQQLAKLDELVKSRFVEIFGDTIINTKEWKIVSLERVANIVSGITKGRKTKEQDLYEVPYMAVSNVKNGYIDMSIIKTIMATKSEIEQYQIKPYDILMTEGGDPDKLGRGAIITNPPENCIHQNHIFRVRLDTISLLPIYFAEYLQHPKAKRYFLGCAKQTTGIASVNMKQLRALPVLLPPLNLQNQFAPFAEQTEKTKSTIKQSLERLETLKKSLMQEFFG